jgi:glycerol-3-phosphate acyltransferase PlsY
MITLLSIILLSYLIGSFPTGFVFGKAIKGIDIRSIGSKSIGATNTGRLLGTKIAIIVLAIDILKGFLATALVSQINLGDLAMLPEWIKIIAGLSAILGHIFPVWIGFKGGKGVGTGAGMLLGLIPLEMGFGFVLFIIVVALTRYISLGSILAAGFIFIALVVESRYLGLPIPQAYMIISAVLLITVLVTHRGNIRRLIRGQENKFGQKTV